jgi:hypothetical protein
MKRLIEQSSDAVSMKAAVMIRGAAIGEPSVAVEKRVRAQLLYRSRRPAPARLRPAFVGCLLIGSVACAAIAVHEWRERASASHASVVVSARAAAPSQSAPVMAVPLAPRSAASGASATQHGAASVGSTPHRRVATPVGRPSLITTAPVETSEPTADVAAPTPDTAAVPIAIPASPVVPAPSAPPVVATPSAPEPSAEALLVLQGARALRRDRAPARASALLEDYLRRYPHGDLVEEALALAVQARAQQDDARAAALARQYLVHFPKGRFRDEAQAAVRRFAP